MVVNVMFNHPVAGYASSAFQFAVGSYLPGVPEPGRWTESV